MQITDIGRDLDGNERGWLDAPAAASLARVERQLGHLIPINDAGRTREQQQALWDLYWSDDRPDWLYEPARPGESPHESGMSIDTDPTAYLSVLEEHGWRRPMPDSDPVHYNYWTDLDQHLYDPAPEPVHIPEGDDMSSVSSVSINGNQYGLDRRFISHYGDGIQAKITRQVSDKGDELHVLRDDSESTAGEKWNGLLDGLGIPRDVLDAHGRVLNPETGVHEANGVWSEGRVIIAMLKARK